QPPDPDIPPWRRSLYPYAMWTALALAVLTKGLVALVFFLGTAIAYLILSGEYTNWRALKPIPGTLLFLIIAAPWHILAGLRNTGGMNGHGFFWFYFINEHVLRFLGRRIPRDYNKLPGYLYWSLHLVWLFPWSLFAPAALITAYRKRRDIASRTAATFRHQTILLLIIYSFLVLAFFSLSTNQEYYTFPAYLPLLMLLSSSLARAESDWEIYDEVSPRRWINVSPAAFPVVGLAAAAAIAYGLWLSRNLPSVPDIGNLLAH